LTSHPPEDGSEERSEEGLTFDAHSVSIFNNDTIKATKGVLNSSIKKTQNQTQSQARARSGNYRIADSFNSI